MLGLFQVAGAHIDLQQVIAAGTALDLLLAGHQIAGHQCKQIAGLLCGSTHLAKWRPSSRSPDSTRLPLDSSTGYCLAGAQRDGVHGHHVGAVQEVGDAAETFCLALREERVLAHIQAHELGVLDGGAGGEDLQLHGLVALGQVLQYQLVAVHLEGGTLRRLTITRARFSSSPSRRSACAGTSVAAHAHLAEHARLGRVQVKSQIHGVDPPGRSLVVGTVNGGGRGLPVTQLQHIDSFLGSEALLERGFDKHIQIAVQHLLGGRDFDVGAQVLMRLLSST